jgi:hypothetical protein
MCQWWWFLLMLHIAWLLSSGRLLPFFPRCIFDILTSSWCYDVAGISSLNHHIRTLVWQIINLKKKVWQIIKNPSGDFISWALVISLFL